MSLLSRWRFDRALKTLGNAPHSCLQTYANADWPGGECLAKDAPYLALDFELDGLRMDSHLLQAGWTPFQGSAISLRHAQSIDIRSDATLDVEAVTIHGIGEQRAACGEPLGDVIAALIEALSGRIMVAHAAGIERHALTRAAKALFVIAPPIRSVCTLTLERELHPNLVGGEAYRLGPTRSRYGLPDYAAHDALTDAIAAAELFQAQLTRLPENTTLSALGAG
ncbi:MAG: exonuclease domain-containing protein [Erythrobacter sp.]